MAYNPTYKKEKTKIRMSTVFPMILLFLIIIGASFYAGMLGDRCLAENATGSGVSSSSTASSPLSGNSETSVSVSAAVDSSSQSVEPTSEATPEPTEDPEPAFVPLVDKTAYADLSYFDDAVFIGDSVSSGLSYYGFFPEKQVLADTSVNFESVLYKTPFTDLSGNYVSTYDAVVDRAPAKIYIMLGANGIEWLTVDKMMGYYETLITNLQELLPKSVIYVQSVLPVTEALDTDPERDLTNAKIDAYNLALYDLAGRLGVYYLNVTENFKNADGYLPDDASPFDGLHFTKSYYNVWIEYLRNHALFQPEATPTPTTETSAAGAEG